MADEPEKKKTPGELQRERENAGKRGLLWTIEVTYIDGHETKLRRIKNLWWSEVLKFREDVFIIGFSIWLDPGHFKVVRPQDVETIECYRQNGYNWSLE